MKIPFNQTLYSEQEIQFAIEALKSGEIGGDGAFTEKCHSWFREYYRAPALLTTSGTDALELAALLLVIKPGDEVIIPSYTFSSTANAFLLRGANLRLADSSPFSPHMDPKHVEQLISSKTKCIVPMHYGGIACDMEAIKTIAQQAEVKIVEDAAHAFGGSYKGKPLGSIGTIGTLSFHETKNINCGEGGLVILNDSTLAARAEILREKGTNRSSFYREEIKNYEWVDIGSSFLPSELISAVLWGQLLK